MNDKPIVITVYLRKGGTGKSTLVALLGQFLAATGFRVVIIDLDRQGSQSALFDLVDETGRGGENLHLVLKRRVDILAARLPVPFPALAGGERGELYLVPGGPQTAEAIEDIADNPVKYKTPSALDIVRGPIEQLTGHADFVLMDMGPSDQVAALAGLVATDYLIIPTTMDYLAVTSIAPVMEEVDVAREVNPGLEVLGIVPMMTRYYFGGLRKSQTVQVGEEFLNANYGDSLLRDGKALLEFPYSEEVPKAMWAGVSLLSDDVSKVVRASALHLLNGLAERLGLEGVRDA
jgi:chromosome partitioning protein